MSFLTKYYLASKLAKLPMSLALLITLICFIGIVMLWSAAGGSMEPWAYKQLINFIIFFPIAIVIAIIDTKFIFKFSYLFYVAILLLLFGVELFGYAAKGGKRWMDLGFIKLQPSEPAKIAIVLMVAKYFHQLEPNNVTKLWKILPVLIAVLVPAALIIKQPDLGTGVITLLVAAVMLFAAGLRLRNFIIAGILGVISLPIIWHMMHDYQRSRVLVFLNPSDDPLRKGYNIIQSKIAIGSGGLFGKGLTKGTQSQLDFLPEHQTDFIFAFLAEETGFIGCLVLLALYLLVIYHALGISINCRNVFGKLMTIGVTTIFFSHIFINIAMVAGVVPVVGVPLPFISYGGTMMASMLIGFGLIMNVQVHQHSNRPLA